ncbi:hypothetical protein RA210_U40038 [Rubrivivax sp. A210]|uniref:FkbM family methyltransferase n=1 Tax=Rubrivivax sp. A210 TaxID=2772301 RepID=UPI001918E64E|nr:FkbM family methyltransferase [Rubrivivax sp. A210]CAD5373635.1 hypothetical protein RA210_U40038 [Rubrivivax sp. A210]
MTPSTEARPLDAWLLHTRADQFIYVPGRVSSLTTYVLLEQEQWFETEIGFVGRLLEPGCDALDIGANHGVYTLALAQGSGSGHVWSFEPTADPRARLRATVQANGLEDRVTVVPCALSDHAGRATFHTSGQSELNSLYANGGEGSEEVELETLDAYAARHLQQRRVGFVKIDAEGEELRVLAGGREWFAGSEAIVMFELMHGRAVHLELLQAFRAMGYGVFRHLPGLDLLVEFTPGSAEENAWVLNLFAIKPAQQQRLAGLGLLVGAADLQAATAPLLPHEAALMRLAASPPMRGLALPLGDDESPAYAVALAHAATAQLGLAADAGSRLRHLMAARAGVEQALGSGQVGHIAAWTLLVHCLYALGERAAALGVARELMQHWPGEALQGTAFMPALAADLQRPRGSDAASWMQQTLAEFIELRSRHSSFFAQDAAGGRLAPMLAHPDHSLEIERRYFLDEVRHNRVPEPDHVRLLADGASTRNTAIWKAWLEQMRSELTASEAPLEVLLPLLDRPLAIVDVGASTHGSGSEPYANLLATGHAHVTGFEPDAKALDELKRTYPEDGSHRFLPHFVGDGGAANFHSTTWFMTGSLLAPDPRVMEAYQNLGEITRETGRSPVQTVRLDDVIAPGGMDLLKIDVQGAEAMVFDGAAARLRDCLAVWTEVEFVPLYKDQPLFGDIDRRLAAHGLRFFCFVGFGARQLASWQATAPRPGQRLQQLWADALYLPTPERMARMDRGSLARLALLCHEVLGAPDVCHAALNLLAARTGTDAAERYARAMQAG